MGGGPRAQGGASSGLFVIVQRRNLCADRPRASTRAHARAHAHLRPRLDDVAFPLPQLYAFEAFPGCFSHMNAGRGRLQLKIPTTFHIRAAWLSSTRRVLALIYGKLYCRACVSRLSALCRSRRVCVRSLGAQQLAPCPSPVLSTNLKPFCL